jgi:hypothetical protein
MDLIWVEREQEYFWLGDWTGQISLIALANFRFWRNAFGREVACKWPDGQISLHIGHQIDGGEGLSPLRRGETSARSSFETRARARSSG